MAGREACGSSCWAVGLMADPGRAQHSGKASWLSSELPWVLPLGTGWCPFSLTLISNSSPAARMPTALPDTP